MKARCILFAALILATASFAGEPVRNDIVVKGIAVDNVLVFKVHPGISYDRVMINNSIKIDSTDCPAGKWFGMELGRLFSSTGVWIELQKDGREVFKIWTGPLRHAADVQFDGWGPIAGSWKIK